MMQMLLWTCADCQVLRAEIYDQRESCASVSKEFQLELGQKSDKRRSNDGLLRWSYAIWFDGWPSSGSPALARNEGEQESCRYLYCLGEEQG